MAKTHSNRRGFPLAASLALHKGDRAEAVGVVRREWDVDPAAAEAAVDDYARSNLGGSIASPAAASTEMLRSPAFIRALVLDSVGGIAVALGLAAKFAHVDILPPPLRFENYEWVLMGGGVLLMLPMVAYLLGRAQRYGK
jgi:hypothetical protein